MSRRDASELASMTSFGRGSAAGPGFKVTVTIRSVNHRFLQLGIRLPPELGEVQDRLLERVRREVERGKVDVTVEVALSAEARYEVEVHAEVVEAALRRLQRLARRYRLAGPLTADSLLRIPNAIVVRPRALAADPRFAKALEASVERAARSLRAMRRREGAALGRAMRQQLRLLARQRQEISRASDGLRERYQARLKERLRQFNQGLALDEDRLLREAAYLAERADITEELVRLASHIQQAEHYLSMGGAQGKRLEFLIQELHREANTMADKAGELAVAGRVVEIKAAVERLREQVQNLE